MMMMMTGGGDGIGIGTPSNERGASVNARGWMNRQSLAAQLSAGIMLFT